jgi:hypothetical protein
MRSKQKKVIKIFFLSGLVVALGVGIFLVGKNFGESKKETSTPTKTSQKTELEKQLKELKSQLQKETNATKKQELEQKKKDLEQQIKNLGGTNNPKNPPLPNPSKTHRQLTIKYNTEVGGKHEYINISDYKERILIDTKNKIFASKNDLYIKDNHYNFSFDEEDAEKKSSSFIFDENNDKFQLTPISSSPPSPPNNNSEWINIEVK